MWPFRTRRLSGTLDERLRAYVREELPGRLGLPARSAKEPTIREFARAKRSELRRVELEGHAPIVLRLAQRKHHLRRLAGYPGLHKLLAGHAIPVPRLLFVDAAPATRRRYGFGVLAEEHLNGQVVAELPAEARPDALLSLAEILARLHRVRHGVPGKPWVGQRWRVERWVPRRCEKLLAQLGQLGLGPEAGRGRALTAWFTERLLARHPEPFPLVHGDLNPGNILVTENGRLHLLDLAWMAYWLPQLDVYIAEYWVQHYAPGRAGEFLDRYFQASGREPALRRESYEVSRAVFAAWVFLRMAGSRSHHAARQKEKGQSGWQADAQEARELWDRAEGLLRQAGAP